MTKKPATKINQTIEKTITQLMKDVMSTATELDAEGKPIEKFTLTDKMKILDRALKWEMIKQKVQDEDWGKGFYTDNE